MINGITFSQDNRQMEASVGVSSKLQLDSFKNKTVSKTINLRPMIKAGAKVEPTQNGFRVTFPRTLTASVKTIEFVKSMLKKCTNGKCDLIDVPDNPLWDIEEIGTNKFLIKQL